VNTSKTYVILTATLLLCLLNVGLGWFLQNAIFVAGGLIGFCYILLRMVHRCRASRKPASRTRPTVTAVRRAPVDPNDTEALVEQMLAQGRYALLLRPRITGNLNEAQFNGAMEALKEAVALVPDGEVVLGQIDQALDDGKLDDDEIVSAQARVIKVQRFFLDRFAVTNRQFCEFVAGGGYEQMPLWDEPIWPAVLDMVDRTGLPGPRYWRDGCFLPGEENHPVVGISWYEATAYARWVGKRLPSDAEWVKAGSWPVPLSATSRVQRKYPWGDEVDRTRANLWGSGSNKTVDVDQFEKGVSVGGVYQLVGNVWEWTAGDFHGHDHGGGKLVLPTPMKSIRGGAFDTYFDNQATCQFQSGESPLQRKHNIGFRCSIGVCDLALTHCAVTQEEPAAKQQAPLVEEVLA